MARVPHGKPAHPVKRLRYRPAAGRSHFTEFHFVKRIDNSRLRREVDPARRRDCFALLGLSALVFVFVLLFAWQHFECVRCGYQTEQLKAQQAALVEWNHQLHLEQAALADPHRIDALARSELGLAPPEAQQVIQLRGGEPRTASVRGEESAPRSETREVARNFPAGVGEVSAER